MDKNKFFIGIGLPKTGSTWLYRTLQQHPEVKMPPVKEINYFWIEQNLGKTHLTDNLFGKKKLMQLKRKWSFAVLKISIRGLNWRMMRWVFIYFCMPSSHKQYRKLFHINKLSGDISPNYSGLLEKGIEEIRNINPNTKIIIGLRDPIAKVWSQAKMKFLRNGGKKSIKDVEQSEILSFLGRKAMIHSNNYIKLLQKWKRYFKEEKILVYYFEELEEDPQKLFNRICTFLEIEPITLSSVSNNPNKGVIEEIPTEYEEELIKLNYSHIAEFAKAYPNKYSLAWLAKYKNGITK